jgi:hypothetical protein
MEFTGTLTATAGGDMDGLSSPPVDFSKVEGSQPGKATVEVLLAADWAKLWPHLEPVMSALFEIYPAATRDNLRALMTNYRQMHEDMGPILAGQGDFFGEKGPRFTVRLAPRDANSLLAAIETMIAKPEYAQIGATFTSVGKADSDGATVRDYRMKLDVDKLFAQTGTSPPQKNVMELARQWFGADGLPVQFAGKGGRAVLTIGPPPEDAVSSLSKPRGSWSEGMRSALQHVSDCNPMLIERIDIAAIMRAMRKVSGIPGASAMPEVPADATASVGIWLGIRDREWRFGLAIDAMGLGKMTKAMKPR